MSSRFVDGIYSPSETEFQVKILKDGVTVNVGVFNTRKDAEIARDKAIGL